jgi:hypothetical protein
MYKQNTNVRTSFDVANRIRTLALPLYLKLDVDDKWSSSLLLFDGVDEFDVAAVVGVPK